MKELKRSLFIKAVKEIAPTLIRNHLVANDALREMLISSRESRLAAETQTEEKKGCLSSFGLGIGKTVFEYVPTGLPWGFGDFMVGLEGYRGEEFGNNRKMDYLDSKMSIILAVIPGLPSVLTRGTFRRGRFVLEEMAYKADLKLRGLDEEPQSISKKSWLRAQMDSASALAHFIAAPPMF